MNWVMTGAISGALAVVLGAYAAHGLDKFVNKTYLPKHTENVDDRTIPLAWKRLNDFKTGTRYQMYHALALVAVGLAAGLQTRRSHNIAGWSFLLGSLLFSGSLYVLTFTNETRWGAVTPFGGLLFIVGWIALAVGSCRGSHSQNKSP